MKTLIAAALLLAPIAPATAGYVYAPGPEAETTELNSNGILFDRDMTIHEQLIFNRQLFTGPVSISALSFRYDSSWSQIYSSNLVYDFGRTTILAGLADLPSSSAVFANNFVGAPTTVLDRPYSLTAPNTGPAAGPRTWDFVFTFDTPFNYDPAGGDLILDLMTGSPTGVFGTVDFARAPTANRIVVSYANNSATVGRTDTSFPAARLTVGPPVVAGAVPEPASWITMVMGFGLLGIARRRRADGRVLHAAG